MFNIFIECNYFFNEIRLFNYIICRCLNWYFLCINNVSMRFANGSKRGARSPVSWLRGLVKGVAL